MPDGTVWLLTSEGVQRYQHGAVTRQAIPSAASVNSAGDETILGIQFGPGGAVWTRSARSISVRLPGFERVLQTGRDLPSNRITALYVDRQGTGWIGTDRGLFSFEPVPKAAVRTVDPLRMESILSIMEDREGNLWIGTETSGLHALRPRKFRSEPAAAGEAVTAGARASDGTVWFGTREDGVRRIRNGIAEQPVPHRVAHQSRHSFHGRQAITRTFGSARRMASIKLSAKECSNTPLRMACRTTSCALS